MTAPKLGRALRFALFDLHGRDLRGPFYRVRHDDPGTGCGDHDELAALLHDCSVVIAGAAGCRMTERLRDLGIEVLVTTDVQSSARIAAAYVAGKLH